LRVSGDGAGVLLATESPLATTQYVGYQFTFDGSSFSSPTTLQLSPTIANSFVTGPYFWPSASGALVQVGGEVATTMSPSGTITTTSLPTVYGNAKLPPVFQATSLTSGIVISSGDGRIIGIDGSDISILPGATSASPPFLNFQSKSLGSVWAKPGGVPCLIDNREGRGGFWALDSSAAPKAQYLSGSYLSSIKADATGTWVAVNAPSEQVVYLVHIDSNASLTVSVPVGTTLL
jgi:hypothetical protein